MTPHTSGIQVTGLVSWRRIFQRSVVSEAPLTPRSWRMFADPSFASSLGPFFLAYSDVDVDEDVDVDVDGESVVSSMVLSKGKKDDVSVNVFLFLLMLLLVLMWRLVNVDVDVLPPIPADGTKARVAGTDAAAAQKSDNDCVNFILLFVYLYILLLFVVFSSESSRVSSVEFLLE